MRNAFAKKITEIAAVDQRVVLLSGDIGNRLFDDFKLQFPNRFYNCGVAEQNMTGVAAGLAIAGLKPLTYTITQFNTSRCLEQIRTDVCYHNVPVVVVGVGSGLSYSGLGPTHHSLEDIAIMRSMPNMTVFCPADPIEVEQCLERAISLKTPSYIRLGKKGEKILFSRETHIVEIGKSVRINEGSDCCILSTGTMLEVAMAVVAIFKSLGLNLALEHFPTVKPIDRDAIISAAGKYKYIFSLEEHSKIGGFGSAIAEVITSMPSSSCALDIIGTPDFFFKKAGNQSYAREELGLSAKKISEKIQSIICKDQ